MLQDTLNINQRERGNIHYKIVEISKGIASLIILIQWLEWSLELPASQLLAELCRIHICHNLR